MSAVPIGFSGLGLVDSLLHAVAAAGYTTPTPIQLQAMPAALAGQDVLGLARTGSGKTTAFALPLLQRLAQTQAGSPRRARALVLVPTRELATQVGQTLSSLADHAGLALRVSVVFGGVSINPQMMALRGGTDVVVATPGRLLDLAERNALNLGAVQTLVLDEADRLLDVGFGAELNALLEMLPPQRQSLFFSATLGSDVQALADALLRNPHRVEVLATVDERGEIHQRAIAVDDPRRTQLLRHLIQTEGWERVLVFVATKHASEIVADKLRKAGIRAEPFHGTLSQGKRTQVLADFKTSGINAVIATDVAARGLDIAGLPAVVNYDLPRSATDYTHRIGRTGRAGQAGLAVSFVSADAEPHFKLIEKRHSITVAREQVAGFERVQPATPMSTGEAHGGVKGKRPSKKDKLRAAGLLPPAL